MSDAETPASRELARLLDESERYAEQFDRSRLSPRPLSGLAIVTCMDARIVVEDIFGLRAGDANVLRNAGAVASDDVVRSLILSEWVLGSSVVLVVGHTGCGLNDLSEADLVDELTSRTGRAAAVAFGTFSDVDAHVAAQVDRIRQHPWIRAKDVLGFVYEVETGALRAVDA